MLLGERPYTFDRVVRIALSVALLWGVVRLLAYLSDVLIPFAVALLLAYLLNPLVETIQRRVTHRGAAVLIALALVLSVLLVVGWAVAPQVAQQVREMGRIVSRLGTSEWAAAAAGRLPEDVWAALRTMMQSETIHEWFADEEALGFARLLAGKVLPGVWGVIAGTASFFWGLMGLVIVLLYLVFLLVDFHGVRDGLPAMLPTNVRVPLLRFAADFDTGMRRYFRGQAAVAGLVGILFAVGFSLIGLPMGILLGLFIGLLNMVPYLQVVGLIPAYLLAVLSALDVGGSVWGMVLLTTLVFVVVQSIQDLVLTPRILGKATGLRPAVILLSLSVWGKLLGLFGLLIALPLTVLLWTYYQRFLVRVGQAAEPAASSDPDVLPDGSPGG